MDPRPRIALLIDADNSSATKIDLILNELSAYGETSIRRAYGNWTKAGLRPWADVLHPRAIRPVQQYDYSRGKNASDMAMVVDAMALLYNDHPDAFGIVSSDADFTPLVMHLREKGAAVYGFGERKTPEPFRSACTKFLFLDQLAEPDEVRLDESAPSADVRSAVCRRGARGVLQLDGQGHQVGQEDGTQGGDQGRGEGRPAGGVVPGPPDDCRAAPGRRSGAASPQRCLPGGRRRRLGQCRRGRQQHLEPVVLRLPQPRLRLVEQAAQGHRALRGPHGRQRHVGARQAPGPQGLTGTGREASRRGV